MLGVAGGGLLRDDRAARIAARAELRDPDQLEPILLQPKLSGALGLSHQRWHAAGTRAGTDPDLGRALASSGDASGGLLREDTPGRDCRVQPLTRCHADQQAEVGHDRARVGDCATGQIRHRHFSGLEGDAHTRGGEQQIRRHQCPGQEHNLASAPHVFRYCH